jgi:protein SCO1/2
MSTKGHRFWFVIWAVTGLVLVGLTVSTFALRARLVAEPLPVLGEVGDFRLTNQLARAVTVADLRDQVWVANIIFTRCPGICPVMTQNLARVQAGLSGRDPVRLVSLTADPEYDTVEVLRVFAEGYGADPVRWMFLTGEKADLYEFAVNGLKLTAMETEPSQRAVEDDLFVHSGTFVLIDRKGRLRAAFDGTEPGVSKQVLAGIKRLLREGT